ARISPSFLAAVQAAIVPAVAPKDHFHSAISSTVAPQGKNVTINGKKFDPTIAVLMLMDVFGLPSPDNLADQWAAAGFQVNQHRIAIHLPRFHHELRHFPLNGNLTTWIVNHGEAQTTPPLLAVIKALKARGIKQIAATGYCFGDRCGDGDGQYLPGYFRRQFDGVAHGFAVRANASDPVQVAAKQGAFDTSLAWIKAISNSVL
ncbi:hypothetical protein B0H13DRAFT_1957990, partial [Mycena leptocephala]